MAAPRQLNPKILDWGINQDQKLHGITWAPDGLEPLSKETMLVGPLLF